MPAKSLFQPSGNLPRNLRVVLYGPENTGKTWSALTFPKPAVFDTEDGTKLYAPTRQFFQTLSQSLDDLHAVCDYIQANPDEFGTLIIDSISTIYSNMVAAYTDERGRVAYDRWAHIHTTLKALYNRLVLLPVHVVITAHEANRYQSVNRNIEKIGIKADADDALMHFADIVVRMARPENGKDRVHGGYFEKIRGVKLAAPVRRDNIDYEMFLKAAQLMTTTSPATEKGGER